MIKNLNEKYKAVGKGMAKVANQKSATKVPANLAWGSGGSMGNNASPRRGLGKGSNMKKRV